MNRASSPHPAPSWKNRFPFWLLETIRRGFAGRPARLDGLFFVLTVGASFGAAVLAGQLEPLAGWTEQGFFLAEERPLPDGLLYPLFLRFHLWLFGPFPAFVWAHQALLNGVSLLLLRRGGETLIGRRASIVGAVFLLLYPPFHLAAGRLVSTSVTMACLLGVFVLLSRSMRRQRFEAHLFLWAGLGMGIVVLLRPLLIVPALLVLPFMTRAGGKRLEPLRGGLHFGTGLLVPLLLVGVGFQIAGRSNPLIEPLDQLPRLLETTRLETNGWLVRGPGEEGAGAGTGDAWDRIRKRPAAHLWLLVTKAGRLWANPDNPYRKSFAVPYDVQRRLHRFLILLAIFGAVPLFTMPAGGIWIALVAGWTAVYALTVPTPESALPIFPLTCLLAGIAVVYIFEPRSGRRPVWVWLFGGLATLFLWNFFDPLAYAGYGEVLFLTRIFWLNGAVILGALALCRCLRIDDPTTPIRPVILYIAIAVGTMNLVLLSDQTWQEWSTELTSRQARQTYWIEGTLPPGEAFLAIDWVPDATEGDLLVRFDDRVLVVDTLRSPRTSPALRREDRFRQFARRMGMPLPGLRQWRLYPIEREELGIGMHTVDVSSTAPARLFGDLAWHASGWWSPAFPVEAGMSSFQKLRMTGDHRVWTRLPPATVPSVSARLETGLVLRDLSPQPGYQAGSYRIRLIFVPKNGPPVVY